MFCAPIFCIFVQNSTPSVTLQSNLNSPLMYLQIREVFPAADCPTATILKLRVSSIGCIIRRYDYNEQLFQTSMEPSRIQVIIRKRPLSEKENANGEVDIISVQQDTRIIVREPKLKLDLTKYVDEHTFNFDAALGEHVSNVDLYMHFVRPILGHVFEGNKATVFAFGQTGSGKTYTMNGNPKKNVMGLYSYAAHDIFTVLQQPAFKDYSARCTFYELYCGKLFDLLNQKTELKIGQDKKKDIKVVGGTEVPLYSADQLLKCIKSGMHLRTTSQNGTNIESSRSHAILQISIFGSNNKLFGQISFIDLAGCERGADTIDQNKQTKVDGAQINKSLLALKQCIRAMDNNKKHVPFRGSKLTMILRDSFTDNCRTLMIGNISPGNFSCENTLNTLRYSDTVKQLKKTKQPLSKQDVRAKELMLTRHQKNTITVIPNENSMEEEIPTYNNRLSLKQPTFKQLNPQQNNINYRNVVSQSKKKLPVPKQKQQHSKFLSKKGPFASTQPLTVHEIQDWENTIQLIRNWDIANEPVQPYQELVSQIRSYLQRQLQEYLTLCHQTVQLESKLNEQMTQALGHVFSHPYESNKSLYQKSTFLSSINQQKADVISRQQSKLVSYMNHLQLQQQCDQKLKQAQDAQYLHNQSNDDEMSMIDEIQSEWNEELFSYEQPQLNRPITRQSLNLQKGYLNNNLMKSFEYRP